MWLTAGRWCMEYGRRHIYIGEPATRDDGIGKRQTNRQTDKREERYDKDTHRHMQRYRLIDRMMRRRRWWWWWWWSRWPSHYDRRGMHWLMWRCSIKQALHWHGDGVYAMARNLACRRGKNSWQCACRYVAMRVGEVVRAMSWRKFRNVQKFISKVSRLVTTTLLSTHAWH